jgi:DNA-binding transcriptional LysR family regulator
MVKFEDQLNTLEGFSLERLLKLKAVYESNSIADAAKSVKGGNATSTASLISRNITELESFFGAALRRKEGRILRLNESGEELAQITKRFVSELQEFIDGVQGRPATVTIGSGNSLIENILIPGLKELREESKVQRIFLRNRRSEELAEEIQNGSIDLALFSAGRLVPGMESREMGKVGYKLYVPEAMCKGVDLRNPFKSISQLPMGIIDGTGELRTELAKLAIKAKLEMLIEFEFTSHNQCAQSAKEGISCAVLPEFYGKYFEGTDVQSFPLDKLKSLKRDYVVAWKNTIIDSKARVIRDTADAITSLFQRSIASPKQ